MSRKGRFRVEVIGRYANHSDQGERVAEVLHSVPNGPPDPKTPTTKQAHRRLREDQIDQLVAGYKRGFTVHQLADEFEINRAALSLI